MNLLLDTNVVSEWTNARPDLGVIQWLAEADEDRVFLSVVSLGELRHGIDRLAEGARRRRLDEWLRNELSARFEGRILPIDGQVADRWGAIVARAEAAGHTLGAIDAFIAATAEVHDLAVVTRNARDFKRIGHNVVNPWRSTRES